MPKKHKCPPPGAPDWMVTYGDMMTLLMCFFVLLVAMSTITENKLVAALGSFQKNLGFLPKHLRILAVLKNTNVSRKIKEEMKTKGIKGDQTRVQTVREGEKITLGSNNLFNPGSATLRQSAVPILYQTADMVRGYPNLLMVTGHTSTAPPEEGSQFENNWDLSWARARAVSQFLIKEGNVKSERFRISAAGPYDPVAGNQYAKGQGRNRRVEILVSNKTITLTKHKERALMKPIK